MISVQTAFIELPLVAILRGLVPERALEVGGGLLQEGFRLVEVPLNSPDPFASIRILAEAFGGRMVVGAGTVLQATDVGRIADAGGRLVVMPHGDPAVIRAAHREGLTCIPGVATPTEAFRALDEGAEALKLFPAEALPPDVVRAWRAILPEETRLLPVGGITPETLEPFVQAGASGFGVGSALFKPGLALPKIRDNGRALAAAYRRALP
jgi:2-dehydro-3-deoxyphosphogalactonate aldolase